MQSYPPQKSHSMPKDFSLNEKLLLKGDFANSLSSGNLQGTNNQAQGFESRRKTHRDSEIDESPGKEGFEYSMSYSPSNPTIANTLSHRARNFPNKMTKQGSNNSLEILKMKEYNSNDILINETDVNESDLHELESKRDSVYVPLELAKYQIKNFEEEMRTIGNKHSKLVNEFEKNNKILENDTEQYYNEIFEKWKEVVKEKILRYRNYYEDIIAQKTSSIEELHDVIGKLEKQNADMEQERDSLVERLNEKLERIERQKNETIRNIGENYKGQIETLSKNNEELVAQVQALRTRVKNAEENSSKDFKNLETLNSNLKENNLALKAEIQNLKDEFSKGIASYAMENIIGQIEDEAAAERREILVNEQENTIAELNQALIAMKEELNLAYENNEAIMKEANEKYAILEKKNSQLKVMLHLERPKSRPRSVTPTDSARNSNLPDGDHSPVNENNNNQSQRIVQEEEKSRLDTSSTMIQQQQQQQQQLQPPVTPIGPLIEQMETLIKKKEKVDNQIKSWIQDFKQRENRYPTDTDKQPIKELYQQHMRLKKQIQAVKDSMMARENTNNITNNNNNNAQENSIYQPVEPAERNTMHSRSMSPTRAQRMRIAQTNQQQLQNVSNISMNISFDGPSHLNTSTNEQSILQGTSFIHGSGLPMPNDLAKLKNENRSLREELHQFRLQVASKFEESDVVTQLKSEIQVNQKEKKALKERIISLTRNLRSLQNGNDNTMSEDVDRKSMDSERFKFKLESENRIKDLEAKHTNDIETLKQECKQQIADIIKAKDILISTTTQENHHLKEENNKIQRDFKTKEHEFMKLKEQYIELEEEIEELKAIKTHMEARIRTEIAQRKKLHNIVEDMKGKVRVFCRVRPMIKGEVERGCKSITSPIDDFNLNLETKHGSKVFPYDSCFGPNISQEQIFEDTKRLIQSAIDGYNVCIFAYGQTSSGKTYTMYGTKEKPGITPRAIDEVYHILAQMESFCEIKVSCHMVELYCDTLIDLLVNKENKKPLEIKEDLRGMVYIQNVTIKQAQSKEDLSKLIKIGMMNRKTSGTAMNDSSSRSHLIVNINIEIFNKHSNQRTIGKLSLVDLAGSERVAKANPNPKQLNEAKAINKSLTELANVISALSSQALGEPNRHVPYRNNKLTMLMKDCLGGTAKTLMFVNVSPADTNLEETQSSLYYATRVKLIVNEPLKNVETKEFSRMKEYLKVLSEERDMYKQILTQNGIPLSRRQLGSLENSPARVDLEDSQFDEGPLYQLPSNDSIKL